MVPADDFDKGVSMLADAVLKPRFDEAEWAIARAETEDWLAGREADLANVADRAAGKVLFPQRPGKAGPDWSAVRCARPPRPRRACPLCPPCRNDMPPRPVYGRRRRAA